MSPGSRSSKKPVPTPRSQGLGFKPVAPSLAYISIGSNMGDPQKQVLEAMEQLARLTQEPLLRSSLYRTTPVNCPPGSPDFVNAVVGLKPLQGETPESLLPKLQDLEKRSGRSPKKILNEPRPLDLDLIAFANEIRITPELTLPHPRAHLRRFVLEPLAEIAPDLILPGHRKSVGQLLADLTSAG